MVSEVPLLMQGTVTKVRCVWIHVCSINFSKSVNVSSIKVRVVVFVKNTLFSVFISHVFKTKNRNRSINKFKNLGYDR